MADINVKKLQTRIALKYDDYTSWTDETKEGRGANLVLLKGELGICAIEDKVQGAQTAPTVLFKVGDGTSPFKSLKWASALAADVYSWAKATDVTFANKKITFVKGNADGTDKVFTFDYLTETEVKAITDGLASRISALENKFGDNGDVSSAITDHATRLDVIEGEGEGSIKKAAADAVAAAAADAASKAGAAEAAAKKYAEGLNSAMDERVDDLEAAKTDHDTKIAANTEAIENEVAARTTAITNATSTITSAYEDADLAINNKIGNGFDSTNTVAKAITDAISTAASTAQNKVDALATGQVNDNKAAIAQLRTDLNKEVTDRTSADSEIIERLEDVEAFFHTAAGETLDDALDTLKEIQDYLKGDEGAATGGIISRVAANEDAIEALQGVVKDGGTLEVRVDNVESRASAVEGRADTLANIVDGYTGKGAVKTAIEAAATKGQTGIDNAATAQAAAEAAQAAAGTAQKEVDALELIVNGVKSTAESAAADLTALVADNGRIKTAENAIDALELVVNDASKGNDKLRTDVNALQALTGDDSKGNEVLRSELTTLQGIVNNGTTGLAPTKAIADEAKSIAENALAKASAIDEDYLKAADFFIIDCGSSVLREGEPVAPIN